MRDSVASAFVAFSSPLEGVVPWMYLDIKGLVTVAIGNLIDPVSLADGVPFLRPDGSPATRDEIRAEWQRVKGNTSLARLGHQASRHVTTLRLTDEGVQQVVGRALATMEADLRRTYPEWDAWPADAQLATLAMAWACGTGFRRSFRRLHAALLAQDWATASQQCTISTAGNAGIVPRNRAMKQLYFLTAALGCEETLHWPAEDLVREWQREHGLVVDGVVGPRTVAALTK
jgi:GH24 family phage-related lysozyme (muramidase)